MDFVVKARKGIIAYETDIYAIIEADLKSSGCIHSESFAYVHFFLIPAIASLRENLSFVFFGQ